jgi:hypothetical protein
MLIYGPTHKKNAVCHIHNINTWHMNNRSCNSCKVEMNDEQMFDTKCAVSDLPKLSCYRAEFFVYRVGCPRVSASYDLENK